MGWPVVRWINVLFHADAVLPRVLQHLFEEVPKVTQSHDRRNAIDDARSSIVPREWINAFINAHEFGKAVSSFAYSEMNSTIIRILRNIITHRPIKYFRFSKKARTILGENSILWRCFERSLKDNPPPHQRIQRTRLWPSKQWFVNYFLPSSFPVISIFIRNAELRFHSNRTGRVWTGGRKKCVYQIFSEYILVFASVE